MEVITCDGEWSHEELYGVAYDECMKACRNVGFLLDDMRLMHPDNLMRTIMDSLGDKNLVDIYDKFHADKAPHESSDEVFASWDQWMQRYIKDTLATHKYKYYAKK